MSGFVKGIKDGVIGMAILMGVCGITGYIDTNYSRYGYVIGRSDGVVTIEDTTGNFWDYEDNIELGTYVKMSMHTNGTDNIISDDIIKKIEKNPK